MNEKLRVYSRPESVPHSLNTSATGVNSNASVVTLVQDLAHDVTSLFSKEVALAKVEISKNVDEAKSGIVSLIIGGSVLFAGILFVLGAVTLILAQYMVLWQAALIVGAIVAIIGFIMIQAGKKKVSADTLTPHHTLHSLAEDQRAVRDAL